MAFLMHRYFASDPGNAFECFFFVDRGVREFRSLMVVGRGRL